MAKMIGKYVSEDEVKCKCDRHWQTIGHGEHAKQVNRLDHVIDKRVINMFDAIRERVGQPLEITSGYRCIPHNAEVGGVPDSQHVLGTAIDLVPPDGMTRTELYNIADDIQRNVFGYGGLGAYPPGNESIHIDVRGEHDTDGHFYRWGTEYL